jgi:hypothetical protein
MMFFKRVRTDDVIEPGSTYRRVIACGVVETARVLTVCADQAGIPHVKFAVRNNMANATVDELRTLAAESFARLFGPRVEA